MLLFSCGRSMKAITATEHPGSFLTENGADRTNPRYCKSSFRVCDSTGQPYSRNHEKVLI